MFKNTMCPSSALAVNNQSQREIAKIRIGPSMIAMVFMSSDRRIPRYRFQTAILSEKKFEKNPGSSEGAARHPKRPARPLHA